MGNQVVDNFTKAFYLSGIQMHWQGIPVFQNPLDMWMMQEVIWDTKPDIIIETGSANGGSALFFTSVFPGEVISIDTWEGNKKPIVEHGRIIFIKGSSISREVLDEVSEEVMRMRCMVLLDSDHSERHVLAELCAYSQFVSPGCYLVVHDTHLGGNPVFDDTQYQNDPMSAVRKFMEGNEEFEVDRTRERFMMTYSPQGWLRRRK